jgi:Putative Flp pilus-assembly TadE/G-like
MACLIPIRRSAASRDRRGSALILTALALIPLIAMVAFAVDWGRLCVTKAELQRAADSAAMAAAWELLEAKGPSSKLSPSSIEEQAKQAAMEFAAMNSALGKPLALQPDDIEIGYLANPTVPGGQLDKTRPDLFNAVRVRIRRDAGSNGSIPMFFARVFGKDHADSEATATATFVDNVGGFTTPLAEDGPHIPILPIALDAETWHAALNGTGPDQWKWDAAKNQFVRGSDGIREFNIYPQRSSGGGHRDDDRDDDDRGRSKHNSRHSSPAADRGTVNIGTSIYDESHLARQILYGISLEDWQFHDGSLTFDENGELFLGGRVGVSDGLKEELSAIRGQGRIIPIFSQVERDNHNDDAVYTIVEWAGVCVVDVNLKGRNKTIMAQAREVTTAGTVSASTTTRKSQFVSSRVWLSQ